MLIKEKINGLKQPLLTFVNNIVELKVASSKTEFKNQKSIDQQCSYSKQTNASKYLINSRCVIFLSKVFTSQCQAFEWKTFHIPGGKEKG